MTILLVNGLGSNPSVTYLLTLGNYILSGMTYDTLKIIITNFIYGGKNMFKKLIPFIVIISCLWFDCGGIV